MNLPEHTTIQSCTITVQPRYSETDQGGVVHHAVYPVYFEMGRTELLRANGLAYKDLEASGVFFVIAELNIKYRRPAFYDEKLNLETVCTNVSASKVEHSYKLTRPPKGEVSPKADPPKGEPQASRPSSRGVLAEGTSILACVDAQGKIRRIPEFMYPDV